MHGSVIALDVGSKTVGLAYCPEGVNSCVPLTTLHRSASLRRDLGYLREVVTGRQAASIVVGLPLMPDGTEGERARMVHAFVASLRGFVRIPIVFQDERYTSFAASEIIAAEKFDASADIHSISAMLILEDYLRSIGANINQCSHSGEG